MSEITSPNNLHILGICLSAIGALVLAFRVKTILDALVAVAHVHEANIQALMSNSRAIINFTNSTIAVRNAQRLGTRLLFVGFMLIVVGNLLNGVALVLAK